MLALSRGAAVIGFEIARALEAPLGLLAGLDWTSGPELAQHDPERSDVTGTNGSLRHRCLHRSGERSLDVAGSSLILVEEDLEERRSALAVLPELRRRAPRRIVLATPKLSFETLRELEPEFDQVLFLAHARGDQCDEPEPVTDEAVLALLERAASRA